MDLEFASGRKISGATEEDIRSVLGAEDYAILYDGEMTYMQCAELDEAPGQYVLEYQEGSLDAHYAAADESIPVDRVISAFVQYLRGDPSWRSDFRWEKLDLS